MDVDREKRGIELSWFRFEIGLAGEGGIGMNIEARYEVISVYHILMMRMVIICLN